MLGDLRFFGEVRFAPRSDDRGVMLPPYVLCLLGMKTWPSGVAPPRGVLLGVRKYERDTDRAE